MPDARPTVFVVDDDLSVRETLGALIQTAGWEPRTFASAGAFLQHPAASGPSCLVLDVGLPDLSGLEVQERLSRERAEMPVIMITGYRDVPMAVRAMKAGAVEFLTKPFGEDDLLGAIGVALERSCAAVGEKASLEELRGRHGSLSPRERQVMELVVAGMLNKQVGAALGISEITVKAHRGRVMEKMKAGSLPQLVKMSERLETSAPAHA